MNRKSLTGMFLAMIFLISTSGILNAQSSSDNIVQGKVRIKVKSYLQSAFTSLKSTKEGIETGIVAFDVVSNQVAAQNMKRVFPYSPKFEEKHKKYGLDLWYELSYDEAYEAKVVAGEYSKLESVEKAEVIRTISLGETSPAKVYSSAEVAEMPFDDPQLQSQWHYSNDGSILEGAVAKADINLFEAWKKQTGSSDVVVAIIDGGIDTSHPDLTDAMWVNDAELNGTEGIDDDGNGYVDDIYGYNFVNDQSEITAHFHGTHVAGTVGAINNNGIGVSGVAGGDGTTSGTSLMSCQMMADNDVAGGISEALVYAADNGALIAQCSWGWTTADYKEEAVLEAIDYFIAEAGSYSGSLMKGGVVIFAAGNEGLDEKLYPGAYEPVISVAAIDYTNGRATYSTYGSTVDISAPGGYMGLDTKGGVLSTYPGGQYSTLQGTSMACPHVSGIAALVVAEYGGSDFTADKLKRHLISSVHDIDPYLTDSEIGKMGRGYIDASLALASGSASNPPAKVEDLVVYPSQDEAKMEWTIVSDADDEIGCSYTLYWSKTEFDSSTLSSAGSTIVDHYFANVGDAMEYTLEDLDPNTTYYFAIKAFDRWGNESPLSDVIAASTNNGPSIEVIFDNPEISIDVKANSEYASTIQLNNNDEGLLNWYSYIGLVNTELDEFSSQSVSNVKAQSVYSGNIVSSEVPSVQLAQAPVTMSMDDRLTYNSGSSYVFIGEEDTSLPNSSATRFYVEEAFNVTNLWVDLDIDPQYGPATLEFYEGDQIQDAHLITSQEIESVASYPISYYVDLEEQVYLQAGHYYWVVVHAPIGNQYPLGLTKETEEDQSENCLFSSNGGQSWQFVNDVYGDSDDYIWKITLRSLSAHLGDCVTLTPSNGELVGLSSNELDLNIDATKLVDGTYNENLIFTSNDAANKIIKLPFSIDVSGHEPILNSQSIVDYSDVFIGKTKKIDVQIVNEGYAGYYLSRYEVSSSNPDFYIESVSSYYIPARGEATIRLVYEPSEEGADYANIELNNGLYNYSFKVNGVGLVPSKIVLTPSTASIGTGLTVGDVVDPISFEIKNEGGYPLTYKIPAFAKNFEIENIEGEVNEFGYTYSEALDLGPDYTKAIPISHGWRDISTSTNIYDKLKGTDYAVQVDLGFSFPFYDRFYDKVWINEQGVLFFGEDGNININNSFYTNASRIRSFDMVSACMLAPTFESAQGAVYYEQSNGEFRVNYKNITYDDRSVDVQIVLYATGDADVLFYSIDKNGGESPELLVGLIDKDNGMHTIASNSDAPKIFGVTTAYNSFFHFKHPGQDMVIAAGNAYGTLLPNETSTITLNLDTKTAMQGDVFQRVPIISNDVETPMAVFEVTGNFIAGGEAKISITESLIDFGEVLKTSAQSLPLQITNTGTAPDVIVDMIFSGSTFSTDITLPYEIGTKRSVYIPIYVNTDIATIVNEKVTITLASGLVFDVNLSADVIENPIVNVTPEIGFTETINAGESKEINLTILNSGLGDMEYTVTPNSWCYPVSDQTEADLNNEFSYTYAKGNGAGWVDILDIAKETNLYTYFWSESNNYKKVELPNSVMFYGKMYDAVYIGALGWMTFEEPTDIANIFERPTNFPEVDNFKGVIAPMVGPHTNTSRTLQADAGIYYHSFEDKFVVTFHKFVDMTGSMSSPYDFQVVINQNGRIDFNYTDFDFVKVYSIIGIESPDETQGVNIKNSLMQGSFEPFSYSLFPIKKDNVDPQSQKDVIIKLDASDLYDGTYSYLLPVNTNDVDIPVVEIPVELNVVGEPIIEVEDMNEVVWYVSDSIYTKAFTIKNIGSKAIQLSSSVTTASSDVKVEFYYPAGGTSINTYEEGYVVLDDFVGSQVTMKPFFGDLIVIADGQTIEPGDKWQCYLTYSPAGLGTSTANVVINDIDGNEVVNWNAQIAGKMPPIATIGDNVVVHADTKDLVDSRQFTIGNVDGQSTLEWTAELKFTRGKTAPDWVYESTSSNTTTNALSSLTIFSNEVSANAASLKSTTSYNRTLKHIEEDYPDNWLGFGNEYAFTSGTKFTTPENGFTLSHIETWFRRENKKEGTLYVEILAGGSSIEDAKVIAKGALDFSETDYDDQGKYYTIPLEESVYLFPEEDFFVAIYYPLGIGNTQGIINDALNAQEGRYYYLYDGEWYDLYSDDSFYDNAFMVKAHEEQYEEKTWIKLASADGTVNAGESFNLDLTFIAENAQEDINYSELVIKTNDPLHSELNADMYLIMNKGPQFKKLEGLSMVEENTTSTVTFSVEDLENDSYSVEINSDQNWVELTKVEDGIVELTLTPDYFSQGNYTIQLKGTEEHDEVTLYDYDVEVINVNRDPVYTYGAVNDTTIYFEHGSYEQAYNDLIIDPDNDEITYTISVNKDDIIDLYKSETGVVITPIGVGSTEVTLVATDENGAKLQAVYNITVKNRVGIDDNESTNIEIYPNPADKYLTILFKEGMSDEAIVRFIHSNGSIAEYKVIDTHSVHQYTFEIDHLNVGIYFVEVISGDVSYVQKVVIK